MLATATTSPEDVTASDFAGHPDQREVQIAADTAISRERELSTGGRAGAEGFGMLRRRRQPAWRERPWGS
jgi:hypothetical protein